MSNPHSSDPAASALDLTNDEVKILEAQQMLFPTLHVNKRKVSMALLSPPPSDASSTTSSSPSPSVRFRSFSSNFDRTFFIPSSIESAAALEFVGFTTEAASEVYNNFLNKPRDSPDDLPAYARGHVSRLKRPSFEDMTVEAALAIVGIKSELRAVFQDIRFAQIRQTETLYYWVEDTINTNFATLMNLQDRLKQAAKLGPSKKQLKRARISSSMFVPAAPTGPTATSSQMLESEPFSTVHTTVETALPPPLPDHMVLFKGKSPYELCGSWIEEDGSLYMDAISSRPKGDFNVSETAYYFSSEQETAELYRQWAAARCRHSESWIIRIQLSNNYLSSLSREDLWWGEDFREFVWTCRKGVPIPDKPNFVRYKSADLLVGHIAQCPQLARMKRVDVQDKFTQDKLVWINNGSTKATQCVFRYRQGEALAREIKGKIHIEVFAPLEQQGAEENEAKESE